jgi:predicted AAA+ superfamily ATPase
VVARAFAELYRTQHQEFPPECHDADYEKRIKAAYPIHPEIFDRLYTDWSTLVKFQRTRGVLRHRCASLWKSMRISQEVHQTTLCERSRRTAEH